MSSNWPIVNLLRNAMFIWKKNHLHYHCVQMKIMKVLFRIGSNFLPSDIILFFCRLSIIHSGSIQSFDRLILSWCTLATRTGSKELYVNVNEMYAPDPWQWAIRPWIISSREKRTGNAYVNRDPPDKSIVPIQRFIIIFYFFFVDSKSQ